VTEVGNSPIQATGAAAAGGRATNFKVVVTIDGVVPNVRPGFTCTAVITTATRQKVIAVPIQAMTVRELVVDEKGEVVKTEEPKEQGPRAIRTGPPPELAPGQKRQEIEGVFMVKDGRAVFVPVKTGIAGEKYFEVLNGLSAGEEVIVGPFASVRSLREGDQVRIEAAPFTRLGTETTKGK
jgi:HlyD family secretion protein